MGEFVVGLGQLALLDRLDRDGHLRILAGPITGGQLGGEDAALLLLEPDDRVVETLDQLARADLVGQPLGLRLRHILAVDGGGQIDGDEIALLRRPLDAGQGAEPGAQRLQLGVDLLVGHLDGVDGELQRLQVGQFDLGPDVDLGGEHELFVVLELGDLDLRLAKRLNLGGGDGFAVAHRQRVVDHLLEHGAAADAGLEQLARRLSWPEAGQPDLLGQLLERAVEIRFELGEGHLHVDSHPGRAQLLDGALHARAPCVSSDMRPESG